MTINKLFLENFQTIKDGVWIDLKPITILVGPNSAGKSAIHDAIYLLEQLLAIKPEKELIADLINRWVRIDERHDLKKPGMDVHQMDKYQNERLGKVGIEIELEGGYEGLGDMDRQGGSAEEDAAHQNLYNYMDFTTDDFDKPKILTLVFELVSGGNAGVSQLVLEANGKPLLSQQYIKSFIFGVTKITDGNKVIEEDPGTERSGVKINLFCDNPAIYVSLGSSNEKFAEHTICTKMGHKEKVGYYFFGNDAPYNFSAKTKAIVNDHIRRIYIPHYPTDNISLNYFWTDVSEADAFEFDQLDEILKKESGNLIKGFQWCFLKLMEGSMYEVKGSRSLPTKDETISFFFDENIPNDSYESFNRTLNRKVNTHNIYWNLISFSSARASAIKAEFARSSPYWWCKISGLSQVQVVIFGERGLKQVNQYLAEELFVDKGYQLQSQIATLTHYTPDGTSFDDVTNNDPPILAYLELIETNGARHQIEDVGSGVGYVIPVLVALVMVDNLGGIVKIQQPELHLHPALQSRLADCFIDALLPKGDKQTGEKRIGIIETHSEHIILRLLKRVKDKKSPLTNNDISIIYLNPNIEKNYSEIKTIRLAEDGTMVDQWPNGFFEERFEEHFGE